MFHDGHSDPIEGGILMREKKQTPGREKNTRSEIFKKARWGHRAPAQDQLGECNGLGAELSVILTEEVQVKFLLRQRVEERGL